MFDLTQLNDDDLRAALFDAVVERLDAQAQQDRSIAIVNRMPTVVAVSRRGNLLTLSQGLGPWLLRGDLKCRDRRERLKTFNVGRAALQSRLAITPDRIEGTPDEILDRIVAMFLESTAGAEESENRSVQERPAEERRPAVARTSRESRRATVEVGPPASIEVTEDSSPVLQMPDQTISVAAVPPPPDPFQDKTRSALRTYQMLFETARRELDQAQSLPEGNRYFLLSAGVFVALSAEAFFNDLGSRVIPSWSQLQRLDPREKAEVLSIELFNDKVDWSVRPFQSVAAALGFRRALAHAHAETLSYEETRAVDRRASEVPRTRRTAWPEYCDVATIQRWIADVRLVIEYFSRGHDPTEV